MLSRAAFGLSVLLLSVGGCAHERRPPPAAPELYRPVQAIPGDLDMAVRVDLGRMRARLGEPVMRSIRERLRLASGDPPGERLLYDAMERADTVWLAFRPGAGFEPTDNVIVLRGDFSEIRPRSYEGVAPWGPATDLGADWRRLDRDAPTRSAPARLYLRSSDLMVVSSEAEMDSVERSVELRTGDPRVDPPERGVVAFEVRLPTVANLTLRRMPRLAELLAQGSTLRGSADLDASGLRVEVEAKFRTSSEAEALANLLRDLMNRYRDGSLIARLIATRTEVTVSGASAVATLKLNDAELAAAAQLLEGRPSN